MPTPPTRPIVVPQFGARLARDRGPRTYGQIVAFIHRHSHDLAKFTRGQLSRYEAGQVKYPDPVVLYLLAQIYRADFIEWILTPSKSKIPQ